MNTNNEHNTENSIQDNSISEEQSNTTDVTIQESSDSANQNEELSTRDSIVDNDSSFNPSQEPSSLTEDNNINESNAETNTTDSSFTISDNDNAASNVPKALNIKEWSKKKRVLCLSAIAAAVLLILAAPKIKNYYECTQQYKSASNAYNSQQYMEAAGIFQSLGDFRDSEARYTDCYYSQGQSYMDSSKYEDAIASFNVISEYQDSKEKIKECYYNIGKENYLGANYLTAITNYQNAGDFSDASEKKNECLYQYGKSLMRQYNYKDAETYLKRSDYKDSADLAELCGQLQTTRYINGKFYYYGREMTSILKQKLKKDRSSYGAEYIDTNDGTTTIALTVNGRKTGSGIILLSADETAGTCENFGLMMVSNGNSNNNSDICARAFVYLVQMADLSLSEYEASTVACDMLSNIGSDRIYNGIHYECYLTSQATLCMICSD